MYLVPKLFLMGDGYCPVLTLSGLVCRIDWPKLNVLHFKQEHRTLRRVTTEPPPEPPHPRTCPPCLAQVATPTLLRGPPQLVASLSFLFLDSHLNRPLHGSPNNQSPSAAQPSPTAPSNLPKSVTQNSASTTPPTTPP